jgi:hypothetical protein
VRVLQLRVRAEAEQPRVERMRVDSRAHVRLRHLVELERTGDSKRLRPFVKL